jgi:hypothetical protein
MVIAAASPFGLRRAAIPDLHIVLANDARSTEVFAIDDRALAEIEMASMTLAQDQASSADCWLAFSRLAAVLRRVSRWVGPRAQRLQH